MNGNIGEFTSTAWIPPVDPMPEDVWLRAVEVVTQKKATCQWQIGDLWAYGEARYGARKAMTEATEWRGPTYAACMNCASVARRFETSRRREVLSFSHHADVASLPAVEADALLDWAVRTHASTKDLRNRIIEQRKAAEDALPPLPQTKDTPTKVEAWLSIHNVEGDSAWRLRRTAKTAPDLALAVLGGELKIARAYAISVERKREREAALRASRESRSVTSTPLANIVTLRTSRDVSTSVESLRHSVAELRLVCDDNYSSETLRRNVSQEVALTIEADVRVVLRFLSNLARTWAMPELRTLNAETRKRL